MPEKQCPICEATFAEFAEVSPRRPRKAKCPQCGSLERHRFFWLLQGSDGFLPDGGRLLHFAPEPWLSKRMAERYGSDYIRADYTLPPHDVKADIQSLPFRDASFRGLICIGVLEHIPDDFRAMRELARVLEPGGTAVIHVPLQFQTHESWRERLGPVQRREKYGQVNHLRYYGLDVQDALRGNGFPSVDVISPTDRYGRDAIVRYGLRKTARIIQARKQSPERPATA